MTALLRTTDPDCTGDLDRIIVGEEAPGYRWRRTRIALAVLAAPVMLALSAGVLLLSIYLLVSPPLPGGSPVPADTRAWAVTACVGAAAFAGAWAWWLPWGWRWRLAAWLAPMTGLLVGVGVGLVVT